MDNTTAYLAVLARIMQEERAETTTGSWEHYEKLYALVHTDLTTQLKASRYPDAPALQKKAEGLLDEMEPLYLCPELAGTGCLLISDYHTNTLFEPFRRAFLHWADIAPLFRLQTQIPFLIVDSEEDQLEVLNYANRHVALSPAEYELLLTESGKNRVALNKIVQVFLLRTPLAVKNVSLIFDNVYHRAEQLFGGAVSRKIACLNSRGFQTASKRGLDHFDAVTCKPELVPALKAHPALCHCPRMDWAMLVSCLSTIHPILYGFQYRFQALFTQMECYYLRSSNEMQEVVRQITDDIVRLGEKQNDALPQLRQSAKEAGDQLNNEWNALQPVLETIHTCLTENEKDLRDLSSSGKEVPRRVWDAVFEIFFTEEREKTRFGQNQEKRCDDNHQPAYTGISGASAGTGLPEKEGRKTRQCSSRHGRPRRVGKGPDAAGTSEPGQSVPRNIAPVCGSVEAEPAFLWPGILRKKPDCHVPRRRHLGPDRKLPAGISARRRKAVAALQLRFLFH